MWSADGGTFGGWTVDHLWRVTCLLLCTGKSKAHHYFTCAAHMYTREQPIYIFKLCTAIYRQL